jgi:hypothetical protein
MEKACKAAVRSQVKRDIVDLALLQNFSEQSINCNSIRMAFNYINNCFSGALLRCHKSSSVRYIFAHGVSIGALPRCVKSDTLRSRHNVPHEQLAQVPFVHLLAIGTCIQKALRRFWSFEKECVPTKKRVQGKKKEILTKLWKICALNHKLVDAMLICGKNL